MIPHLFSYHLVVLGLLWLCIMLHYPWPSRAATSHLRQPEPEPLMPRRQRANDPKPFAGLIQKPPCAASEHDATHPDPPPPVPPAPMPPTNRRPRQIDTSRHFCPQAGCRYRGWVGLGNLRANGHPNGGPWRPCQCRACKGSFPEHPGTLVHGKRVSMELIGRVIACLAEG